MNKLNREKYDLHVKVATMYYIDKLSQQEISERIHVSRSNVSKMLKACVEHGIVEFKINSLSSSSLDLQKQLKTKFNMKEVVIVPSTGTPDDIKTSVGIAGAEYMESLLHDGMTLGVAWGSTLFQIASHFEASRIYDIDVIQMIGGMGARSINMDGQEIVKQLQRHFNGSGYLLQAPMIVKSPVLKHLLLQEPDLKKHFEKMKQIDIALLGLGSNKANLSAIYKSGHIKKSEVDFMLRKGAVGDICGTQIDIHGKLSNTNFTERVIAIDIENLLKVPLRIGAACGLAKTDAILSAMRGGYINILITDELAARKISEIIMEESI